MNSPLTDEHAGLLLTPGPMAMAAPISRLGGKTSSPPVFAEVLTLLASGLCLLGSGHHQTGGTSL